LAGAEHAGLANADRDAFVHWVELWENEDDSLEEKFVCKVCGCSIPIHHFEKDTKREAKRLRIFSATEEIYEESSSLSDLTLDDGAPLPDNPGKSAHYDNANRT
jgi:hypothetical protein